MKAVPAIVKPHVSLNVRDVEASVQFYRKVFGVEPVKHYREETTTHSVLLDDLGHDSRMRRTGYAKFDLSEPQLNLVLNEIEVERCAAGPLSHLGVQVESAADVHRYKQRFVDAGLVDRDEMAISCCYAKQDKTWLADPDGNEWEFFTILEHLLPIEQSTGPAEKCQTLCTSQVETA